MNCPLCGTPGIPGKLSFACPSCGSFFEKPEKPAKLEHPMLDELPQPEDYPVFIADPYFRLLYEEDTLVKLHAVIDLLTNTAKYAALVLQADYLYSGLNIEKVNTLIYEDLSRPLVSSWLWFLECGCRELNAAGHRFFMQELPDFTKNADSCFEDLLAFRNRFSHDFTPSPKAQEAVLSARIPSIASILREAAFFSEYLLLKREDDTLLMLHGTSPQLYAKDIFHGTEEQPAYTLFIMDPEKAQELNLLPFIVSPERFIPDAPELSALMYDQKTDKRIFYYGATGYSTQIEPVVEQWLDLMRSKQRDGFLSFEDEISEKVLEKHIADHNRSELRQYRKSGKYLQELNVERKGPETLISNFIASDKSVLLLAGGTGSGKSSVLCSSTDRRVAQKKTPVPLLLGPSYLFSPDIIKIIKAALKIKTEVPVDRIFSALQSGFLIYVDGINEVAFPNELIRSIEELTAAHPEVKAVITIRSDRLKDIYSAEGPENKQLYYIPDQKKQNQKQGFSASLSQLSIPERQAIYTKLTKSGEKALGTGTRPKASFQDISFNKTLLRAFASPLVIRIFCEVYDKQEVPAELLADQLFAEYLEKLYLDFPESGLREFLLETTAVMLEKKTARILIDRLMENPETAAGIMSKDIHSPYRTAIRKGILYEITSPDMETLVSFTYDKVFENLIARVFHKDAWELEDILTLVSKRFRPVYGGVIIYTTEKLSEQKADQRSRLFQSYLDNWYNKGYALLGETLVRLETMDCGLQPIFLAMEEKWSYRVLQVLDVYLSYLRENLRFKEILKTSGRFIPKIMEITDSDKSEEKETALGVLDTFLAAAQSESHNIDVIPYLEYSIQMTEALYGENAPETGEKHAILSLIYLVMKKDINRAHTVLQRASSILSHTDEDDQRAKTAKTYLMLVKMFISFQQGDLESAYKSGEYVIHNMDAVMRGEQKFVTRALKAYSFLAMIEIRRGNIEKAKSLSNQQIEKAIEVYGKQDVRVAQAFHSAAQAFMSYQSQEAFEAALAYEKQAYQLNKEVNGEVHTEPLENLKNIFMLLTLLGKGEEGVKYYQKTKNIMERLYKGAHPDLGWLHKMYALHMLKNEKIEECLKASLAELEIWQNIENIDTTEDISLAASRIASSYRHKREYENAVKYMDIVLDTVGSPENIEVHVEDPNKPKIDLLDVWVTTQLDKAWCYYILSNNHNALKTLEFADKVIQERTSEISAAALENAQDLRERIEKEPDLEAKQ
ncbi:MAG: hypothetical protein ACLFR1_04405 [Spirochaetia bacterium]